MENLNDGMKLVAAYKRVKELEDTRESIDHVLAYNRVALKAAREEVKHIEQGCGAIRTRTTKDDMTGLRCKINTILREAVDPMSPMAIAEDAEINDIDQVRRILRDMAADFGPVKHTGDSKKDSKYFWDKTWRFNGV